jgi:hypothetical protein
MGNSTRIFTASCWHEQYEFTCSASLQLPYFPVYSVLLTHNIVLGKGLLTIDYFWRSTLQNSVSTHLNYIVQHVSVQSTRHSTQRGLNTTQGYLINSHLGWLCYPHQFNPGESSIAPKAGSFFQPLGNQFLIQMTNETRYTFALQPSLRRRQFNGCRHWLKFTEINNLPVHWGWGAARSLRWCRMNESGRWHGFTGSTKQGPRPGVDLRERGSENVALTRGNDLTPVHWCLG